MLPPRARPEDPHRQGLPGGGRAALTGCAGALEAAAPTSDPISARAARILLDRAAGTRRRMDRSDLVPTDAGRYLIAGHSGLLAALEERERTRRRRARFDPDP